MFLVICSYAFILILFFLVLFNTSSFHTFRHLRISRLLSLKLSNVPCTVFHSNFTHFSALYLTMQHNVHHYFVNTYLNLSLRPVPSHPSLIRCTFLTQHPQILTIDLSHHLSLNPFHPSLNFQFYLPHITVLRASA